MRGGEETVAAGDQLYFGGRAKLHLSVEPKILAGRGGGKWLALKIKQIQLSCHYHTLSLFFQPHDCVWTHCANPPSPPSGSGLEIKSDTALFEFGEAVSYECDLAGYYMKHDRDQTSFEVNCLVGGSWNTSVVWPKCVRGW